MKQVPQDELCTHKEADPAALVRLSCRAKQVLDAIMTQHHRHASRLVGLRSV